MRTERKLRYYCDYCKKSGGSKWHMEKHERRCTMNPKRECGFCTIDEGREDETTPLKDLIVILPKREEYNFVAELNPGGFETSDQFATDLNLALKQLRVAAQNCPGCMLAAIRQSGLSSYVDQSDFCFKEEAKQWLKDWNAENSHDALGSYYP